MYGEVFDRKPLDADMGDIQPIELRVVQVDHLVTLATNQMVMPVNSPVETGCHTGVVQTPNNPHVGQRIEHPVNGRPRDPRHTIPDRFENFVGGGMVIAFQNGLQDHASLHRES